MNSNAEKILDTFTESKVKDAHFTKFARDLVSHLKDKQQKVISKRFGLSGRKRSTLDAIGKEFGVTRERVRQIEVASMGKLRKVSKLDHNKEIFVKIRTLITQKGGIVSEDALATELIADLEENRKDEIKKTMRFLLLLDEEISAIPEGEHTKSGWSLSSYALNMIEDIIKAYVAILDQHGEVLADEALLSAIAQNEVSEKHKKNISPEFLTSSLDLASKIHLHEGGKRGLITWPWIKPRTVRDKIFYVLSKKNEPMHFADIATEIEKSNFDHKKATVQTVHNELISDSRFVLVGRGLYGLSTWGFEAGTVEEVIEKILKKADGPMDQKDIVNAIMAKKRVKKATILINLQNSKKFKRTKEGWMLVEG